MAHCSRLTAGVSLIALTPMSVSAANILLNSDFAAGSTNWTVTGETANAQFVISSTIHKGFDGGDGFSWYTTKTTGITVTQVVTTQSAGDFVLSGDFLQRNDGDSEYNQAVWTLELLDADSKIISKDSQTGKFPGAGVLNAPSQSVSKSYSNLPAGTYIVRYTIASGQGAVDNVKLDFTAAFNPSSPALLGIGGITLTLCPGK